MSIIIIDWFVGWFGGNIVVMEILLILRDDDLHLIVQGLGALHGVGGRDGATISELMVRILIQVHDRNSKEKPSAELIQEFEQRINAIRG